MVQSKKGKESQVELSGAMVECSVVKLGQE